MWVYRGQGLKLLDLCLGPISESSGYLGETNETHLRSLKTHIDHLQEPQEP